MTEEAQVQESAQSIFERRKKEVQILARKEVKYKVQTFKATTGKALLAPYIDARDVFRFLDMLFGLGNWQTELEPVMFGKDATSLAFVGTIKIRYPWMTEWVSYTDVGMLEGADDDVEMSVKGTASGAFKRAAVQVTDVLGRFLYDLPMVWMDAVSKDPKDSSKWRAPMPWEVDAFIKSGMKQQPKVTIKDNSPSGADRIQPVKTAAPNVTAEKVSENVVVSPPAETDAKDEKAMDWTDFWGRFKNDAAGRKTAKDLKDKNPKLTPRELLDLLNKK